MSRFSAATCRGLIEAAAPWRGFPPPTACFPRLHAAASLKRVPHRPFADQVRGFPRLHAAASLKPPRPCRCPPCACTFSAATCRGLIEATLRCRGPRDGSARFSAATCRGLIEASSLGRSRLEIDSFPRLHAAASLKRSEERDVISYVRVFSAATCRGLIEAGATGPGCRSPARGFPRLHAAASLKHGHSNRFRAGRGLFSAATCRGLIEARCSRRVPDLHRGVFRGYMPRPH